MSESEEKHLIGDDNAENLRRIFDRDIVIETDEDLLALAELVEDESDEASELVIDHDFDFGDGD